ncbi:MAG TPA: cell envelope integrity protein CreD [Rhizomicrobium sp.]|nr:cell envelope integrity protein CreD [Rhizomicrobium sp.]
MASEVATRASRVFRSPGLKFLAIAALTVAMAIPLFFINLALADREQSANGAAIDIATGWGGTQTVAGPVLVVPYTVEREEIIDGKTVRQTERLNAVLLPEDLNVDASAVEETRWRGIFSVPVYRAGIGLRATFAKAAILAAVPPDATVLWEQVSASVLVTDAHGLADNVALKVNGRTVMFQPGSNIGQYSGTDTGGAMSTLSGMSAPLGLTQADNLEIDTRFTLRGSRELSFAPLGRRTTAHMRSGWPSPSFFGAFLPTERHVDKDGFTASWVVPYLARGFGQSFDSIPQAASFLLTPASGVKFYQPVDHYQLVDRSLKYAILFIALAFLIFFVAETVSPNRLHVVQYALVGAAQALFYLLLLSFSEHIGFALAYLIGATATVVLTSLYAVSALADKARAAALSIILAALYALLYVILNAEDFALLIGSCLLFVALAATMYVTRGVDWYGVRTAEAA